MSKIKELAAKSKGLSLEEEKLKKKYDEDVQQSIKSTVIGIKTNETSYEMQDARKILKEHFVKKAYDICPNTEELCNIMVDLCYSEKNSGKSKQFAWDIVGEQMIENLYTYDLSIS